MARRAFTLFELVIVISILVLLGAFVTPTYQILLSQLELNTTVEQVAEEIRLAEQKTVAEQQIYGVTFTAGSTSVPLYSYNTSTGVKTTISTLTLPSYITLYQVNFSNQSDIRFTTAGSPNYSGNLLLRDTIRGKNRKIEIRPSGTVITSSPES